MSKNIFHEMTHLKDLTSSERQVIKYILSNPQKVCNMSIVELGANSYTSASTVSRVCKKLNVEGYSQFRQKICTDIDSYQEAVYMNKNKIPVTTGDTIKDTIDKVIYNSTQALLEIKLLNNEKNFQTAVQMLQTSNKITIFGSGVSNLICHDAMIKGLRMGLNIMAYDYYSEMAMSARLNTPNDMGIIISYTGHTSEMIKIAKILYLNKVPTIFITSNASNEIVENCDLNFYVGTTESFYRIGGVESRMSMQCVLDIIFTSYYNQTKLAKEASEKTFIEDIFGMSWKG